MPISSNCKTMAGVLVNQENSTLRLEVNNCKSNPSKYCTKNKCKKEKTEVKPEEPSIFSKIVNAIFGDNSGKENTTEVVANKSIAN